MLTDFYSLAVLLGCIGLMMYWVVRGQSVYIIAPLSAVVAGRQRARPGCSISTILIGFLPKLRGGIWDAAYLSI